MTDAPMSKINLDKLQKLGKGEQPIIPLPPAFEDRFAEIQQLDLERQFLIGRVNELTAVLQSKTILFFYEAKQLDERLESSGLREKALSIRFHEGKAYLAEIPHPLR